MIFRRFRPVTLFALFLLLLLELHGCHKASSRTPFPANLLPLAPAVATRSSEIPLIPVAVGIYYSPEFLGRGLSEHERRALGPVSMLGDANRRFLDAVFAQLFETIVPVPVSPPLADGAGRLAGVIVPAIETFEISIQPGIPTMYAVTVGYRLTLLSPQGQTLAAWTVTVADRREWNTHRSPHEISGKPAERAMREAGRLIVSGFRDVPGVERWLGEVAPSRDTEGEGAPDPGRPGQ
jgi:hypothetical protein